jgi:ADP-dependent NAD(P)H-hydrate dehydratase / NAD(P)H-hydrate epimerase
MIPVSTAAQVRALDERAIRTLGIPGPVLMENAGRLATQVLLECHGEAARAGVRVLCGRGNNGGDGWVMARHLALAGVPVQVAALEGRMSEDCALNRGICERMGLPIQDDWHPGDDLGGGGTGLLVDALLGTGLSSALRGVVAAWVERANASGLPILAVDLPTGLQADTGAPLGNAIRAATTVTFGRLKAGLLLEPGADHCGEVVVADIGLDAASCLLSALVPQPASDIGARLLVPEPADVLAWLPARARGAHKGSSGHLAVVAGSAEKAGAGVLTCNAAIRAGAGLVTLFVPRAAWGRLGALRAEIMVEDVGALEPGRFSALAVGPGLGDQPAVVARCRALWRDAPVPAVFDADGLNALVGAFEPSAWPRLVTPHPGEAARLLGIGASQVQADRIGALEALAGVAPALLKGRHTLVSGPVPTVNPTGGPALATAGSGDVLTGLVGALLARGLPPVQAGCAGAFLHGFAAELCATDLIVAGDLIERLPMALTGLSSRGSSVCCVGP